MRRPRRRPPRPRAAALRLAFPLLIAASLAPAPASRAESVWVKDEVRLNIRTGAGADYRIIGAVETGDAVEVLERGEGWTRVRAENGSEGWIPEGFLQPEPPARVALARHEQQASDLARKLEELERRAADLDGQNQALAARDEKQREEIAAVTKENLRLRSGARWPEWIAGAALLAAGMLIGAMLHRSATRRASPRIRI
jgi:SH3 domain protein